MEIQTNVRIKQWGNSLGIVIPKEVAIREDLKENEDIVIIIKKKDNLSDLFGKGKGLKISAQKMKDAGRKIWSL